MRRSLIPLALLLSSGCGHGDPDGDLSNEFAPPIALSDSSGNAFLPTIASHENTALVAWHQFDGGVAKLRYTVIQAGYPGGIEEIAAVVDTAGQLRPSVAATASGYVLAWQESNAARAVWLDAFGDVVSGPEVVSSAGAGVHSMRVAAAGEDTAFAWTSGSQHMIALRGPGETLAATPVGTTLISQTVLNFPRIALQDDGTLFLAWRDGGDEAGEWDVLLTSRPRAGSFAPQVNVSNSPGLLSDDISLALDGDTLRIAWVDQDASGLAFDSFYATRDTSGAISEPARFAAESQDDWAWAPSIAANGDCVWSLSPSPTNGTLWTSRDGDEPFALFEGAELGGSPVLTADGDHLAWVSPTSPSSIRYSRRE